jgi:hypothetical protein
MVLEEEVAVTLFLESGRSDSTREAGKRRLGLS